MATKIKLETVVKKVEAAYGRPSLLREALTAARRSGYTLHDIIENATGRTGNWLREDEEAAALVEAVFDGGDPAEDGESEEARLRRWAGDVLDHRAKLILHQGAYYAALVADSDRKILSKPLPMQEAMPILQAHACQHVLAATGDTVDPGLARKLLDYWRYYAEPIDWPEAMALPTEDIWCLHRPAYEADDSVEMPTWRKVLDRMIDPAAFAAWWFGIYSKQYRGRQTLWLYGPNGEDGKSTIISLLARELFGPAHEAISNSSFGGSGGNRFIYAPFEHARVVTYADANNTHVLKKEEFKMISSGGRDHVQIERKGVMPYTSTLSASMVVGSNHKPDLLKANHSLSRLLFIEIAPMDGPKDPEVDAKLIAELPGFLAYAAASYAERCQDNYRVTQNEASEAAVVEITLEGDEQYAILAEKHFDFHPDLEIAAAEFHDIVTRKCQLSGYPLKDFRLYLSDEYGVRYRVGKGKGATRRYFGVGKRGSLARMGGGAEPALAGRQSNPDEELKVLVPAGEEEHF
jgi:hypothetical protein